MFVFCVRKSIAGVAKLKLDLNITALSIKLSKEGEIRKKLSKKIWLIN